MEYLNENLYETNRSEVAGQIYSRLEISHRTFGEVFYKFDLGIKRKSGYVDVINIVISEKILCDEVWQVGDWVKIIGQVRTYNKQIDGRNKLTIVVFAREILYIDYELDINQILLRGFICKSPVKRTSPLGRDICDIMLAVNRMYNKSDYIPCIAWGRNAIYGASLIIGTEILVEGRLQSRNYRKRLENGDFVDKIAYEVSILNLEEC